MSIEAIANYVGGGLSEDDIVAIKDVITPDFLVDGDEKPNPISDGEIQKYLGIVGLNPTGLHGNLARRLRDAIHVRDILTEPGNLAEIDINAINIDNHLDFNKLKQMNWSRDDWYSEAFMRWIRLGHDKAFATLLQLASIDFYAFKRLERITNPEVNPPYSTSLIQKAKEALNGGLDISHWIACAKRSDKHAIKIINNLTKHPKAVDYVEELRLEAVRKASEERAIANNLDLLLQKSKNNPAYLEAVWKLYNGITQGPNRRSEITARLNELPLEYWFDNPSFQNTNALCLLIKMKHKDALPRLQELAQRDSAAVEGFESLLRPDDKPRFKEEILQALRTIDLTFWLEEAEKDPDVGKILLFFKNSGHPVANDFEKINNIVLDRLYPTKPTDPQHEPVFRAFRSYVQLGHLESTRILRQIARGDFPKDDDNLPRVDYGKEAVSDLIRIENDSNVDPAIRTSATEILDEINYDLWIQAARRGSLTDVLETFKMLMSRSSSVDNVINALKTLVSLNVDTLGGLFMIIDTLNVIVHGSRDVPRFSTKVSGWWFHREHRSFKSYSPRAKQLASQALLDPALLGPTPTDDRFFTKCQDRLDNKEALLILALHGNPRVIDYLLDQANQGQAQAVHLLIRITKESSDRKDINPFSEPIKTAASQALLRIDWKVWFRIARSPITPQSTEQDKIKIIEARHILTILCDRNPRIDRNRINLIFYEDGDLTLAKKVLDSLSGVATKVLLLGTLGGYHWLTGSLNPPETQAHHTFARTDVESDVRANPQTRRIRTVNERAALRKAQLAKWKIARA